MGKTAIVIGATGLVGKQLTQQLLLDSTYSDIVIFVRRPFDLTVETLTKLEQVTNQSKLTQHVINFDKLENWQHLFKGDDLFCCLGTTAKQAGNKLNQTKIDLDLPTTIAKIAVDNGIKQMLLVSSTGANKDSASFYLRLKGQLETNLIALNFNKLVIVRPSFLTGQRETFRLGEKVGIWLFNVLRFVPFINKYRPITGMQLATKLRELAKVNNKDGVLIKELEQLFN